MVRVVALSVDPTLRSRLSELSREDPTIVLAGIVANTSDLFDLAEKQRVDVVVVEARLGAQLMGWRNRGKPAPLVVLWDRGEEDRLSSLLDAPASAFLPQDASRKTLAAAIHSVADGLIVAPRSLLNALVVAGERIAPSDDEEASLTPRELEVLAAMADGLSNKAIARRLAISFHTVKFHVAAILEKLGADTRTEAVTKAAQRGIVML